MHKMLTVFATILIYSMSLAILANGLPDLKITAMDLGRADFISESEANIPLSVTIKNVGDTTNTKFKLSVDVIAPFDGYMMQNPKPFTVPGQGDRWYPWKTGLASGATYTFTGSLYVGYPNKDKLLGQTITVIPHVDSCSGDEFMEDYCRVRESNEGNNEARWKRTLRSTL
jgi:hypothetical protein